MDSNPDGTSKHFRDGLNAAVSEGDLALMGFPVIHDSYESLAAQILDLERETGISGLLLTFPDFVPGVRAFGKKVLPMIRANEARHPAEKAA